MFVIYQFERNLIGFGRYSFQFLEHGGSIGEIRLEHAPTGYINVGGNFLSGTFHLSAGGTFGPLEWDAERKSNRKEAGRFQENGQEGIIYNCGEKGSNFFNGIYYWEFCNPNHCYRTYEVGFGRKGIYYCLYENDQLKVIISKVTHTKNFGSGYTIYNTDVPPHWLAMINLYWDVTRFAPTRSSEEWHRLDTWQKAIKNKFDPNFIPQVMRQESSTVYCRDCGEKVPTNLSFCPHCGTHPMTPVQNRPPKSKISACSIASIIFGILSLLFCWCAIAGYPCAVAALLLGLGVKRENQGNRKAYQFIHIGRICALAGLVLTTFFLILLGTPCPLF